MSSATDNDNGRSQKTPSVVDSNVNVFTLLYVNNSHPYY